VDGVGGVSVWGLDQTEDLSPLLVDPVALVLDPVLGLGREVSLMSLGYFGGVDIPVHVVHVHVKRHGPSSYSTSAAVAASRRTLSAAAHR
jgi:hypothetical protein